MKILIIMGCITFLWAGEQVGLLTEQYDSHFLQVLHLLYGEGHLAEGDDESLRLLIADEDLHRAQILDFGCGTGGVTHFIAENFRDSEVVGIDIVEDSIRFAEKKFPKQATPNLTFTSYQSDRLPFPNHSFDFVIAKEVFIHIFDKEEALKEIIRVLKPGGQLIIVDWLSRVESDSDENQIIHLSNVKAFETILEKVGFKKILKTFQTWLNQ